MKPEEKVLEELKQKIAELFNKIAELKVTEAERKAFDMEKAQYRILIEDYKKHKEALLRREARCVSS